MKEKGRLGGLTGANFRVISEMVRKRAMGHLDLQMAIFISESSKMEKCMDLQFLLTLKSRQRDMVNGEMGKESHG